jgi:hypothetical protein
MVRLKCKDRTHNRATLNVKAGTLDDPNWLRPIGNIWTSSAQPWVTIADDLLNYLGQPENTDGLWKGDFLESFV